MKNLWNNNNQQNCDPSDKKCIVDEQFEQKAGVKIHKGKENYGGGNGYYAARGKENCPNVNNKEDKK